MSRLESGEHLVIGPDPDRMAEEEKRVPTPPLPPDTVPLSTQVSGHFYGRKSTKLGMLELRDGTLVKPLIPPKGDAELRFYEEIFGSDQENADRMSLRPLLAKFSGVWTTPLHPGVSYIILENVTRRYNKPCVLDVKVGPRTWQPGASEEKRTREIAKYPLQPQVGFRLLGIKVYHASTDSYEQHDHIYLRTLSAEQIIPKGISVFIDPDENMEYKRNILQALLKKLHAIRDWFEHQTLYHFYASSILFVYEGKPSDGYSQNHHDHLVDVRLIDFTHVCPAHGHIDNNYLTGVQRLTCQLEALLPVLADHS